jgi:hypothetical protein
VKPPAAAYPFGVEGSSGIQAKGRPSSALTPVTTSSLQVRSLAMIQVTKESAMLSVNQSWVLSYRSGSPSKKGIGRGHGIIPLDLDSI